MGASASKPDWYPGEPTTDLPGDCSTCRAREDSSYVDDVHTATTGGGDGTPLGKAERSITSLPVIELTQMEFIASGAFCSVYSCKYQGWSVVAKRVREDLPLPERRVALANMWTEYDCLRPLRHPNVIDAYGMCRVKCRDDYCDWNEKDVCLLLEQLALGTVGHLFGTIYNMEKNLSNALARSRKMKLVPFRSRLDRVLELALALEYVHGGSGVGTMMHRDIKSVNVGFAQNGSLKLMDFGLSKVLPQRDAEQSDTYKMTGEVGSYRYMAPEIVKHEPYNTKADIYSWAILSWEILTVSRPYARVNESTFIQKVVIGGDRPALHKSWPDQLRALITSAWQRDLTKRPSAGEIVSVLKDIKAAMPARERRCLSLSEPSPGSRGGGTGGTNGRRKTWTQASSTVRSSSVRSRATTAATRGGVGVIDSVDDNDGAVSPHTAATAPTSVRKRFSFSLPRNTPRQGRWTFTREASSHSSGRSTGAASEDGDSTHAAATTTTGISQELSSGSGSRKAATAGTNSSSLASATAVSGLGELEGGHHGEITGICGASPGGVPCPLHTEAMTPREIIVDALARETERARGTGGGGGRKAPRTRAGRREGEGRVYYVDDGSAQGAEERGASVLEIPLSGNEPNGGAAESSESGADGSGRAARREGSLRKLFPMATNRSKSDSVAIILASSSRDEGIERPWIGKDVGNDGAEAEAVAAITSVLDAFQNGEMKPGGGTDDLDDHLTVSERGPARYRGPYATVGVQQPGKLERPVRRAKNPRRYVLKAESFESRGLAPI